MVMVIVMVHAGTCMHPYGCAGNDTSLSGVVMNRDLKVNQNVGGSWVC